MGKIICKFCKKEFEEKTGYTRNSKEKNIQFCSLECRKGYVSSLTSGRVEQTCEKCGKVFLKGKTSFKKICNDCELLIKEKKEKELRTIKPTICEKCGKVFSYDWREISSILLNPIPRFCCKSCANSRKPSSETKRKIKESINKYVVNHPETYIVPKDRIERQKTTFRRNHPIKNPILNICSYCGKEIDITYKRKGEKHYCNGTCRNKDLNLKGEIGGDTCKCVSKWEYEFREILEKNNIYYEFNKRNIIPSHYEIDIWLPELKVGIELNGPRHYSEKIWGSNSKGLEDTKRKDKIKQEEMKQKGYKLYVIEDREVPKHMSNKEFFEKFLKERKIVV